MTREENFAKVEGGLGNLGECLVGGSPEEQARRKKIKWRAIAVSVALQTVTLGALVIAPMLAKPAELKTVSAMPIPPYSQSTAQRHTDRQQRQHQAVRPNTYFQPSAASRPVPILRDDRPAGDPNEVVSIPGQDAGPSPIGNISDSRPQPVRPIEPRPTTRIHETNIDPAMLIDRVEPTFPPLARQIRRSGKVELHAIIATDGTIQSLEVVSGDPLFVQSAREAVLQWRYKPTYLNGQPVEIDTFITVVYTLSQP